ncbi:uncharacterized protein LOC116850800 [Odontomachus brunneus]|uniref:uncharacterized protein LOC116850800 n=1 Tax=Odontomachus brunneus TaxID=486640 RepID=UPI0013F22D18|nr:uncharacterized protein LOC116850800 [Odontomachus brunneus]XP_032685364.1 uncharacterized protein LOC116850800 [Odontomachus brunneus]XP_032685365.1 uncharacterized protein LOC116850800 [Odontomachus brunneus]
MLLNESQGVIQWQRAATRTLEILRRAGASQAEASNAAVLIQATYRGYYTRRNLKMKTMTTMLQEEKESEVDTIESTRTIQSVAWLDMMYEESGLTLMRANEAATVIQRAYKRYRTRKNKHNVSRLESTKPMVVEAIVKNLHQRVLDGVVSCANIPAEFGSREELAEAGEELQRAFRNRLARACITEENGYDEEEFTRPEKLDESLSKLVNDTAVGDQEEGREIEVATGRDGKTDAGSA